MAANDDLNLDFLSTLGREYSEVVSPLVDIELVPQDGYEVLSREFGEDDVSPETLAGATGAEIGRVRDIAREYHESDRIEADHIRAVLRETLRHWPPGPS